MSYLLKYRTLDKLLDDAIDDLSRYEDEGMIDRSSLIKVVKTINSDLGIKINIEKEEILDVYRGRTELPDDFYLLNYSTLCTSYSIRQELPGIHIEDESIPICDAPKVDKCSPGYICKEGQECTPYRLFQKKKYQTIEINRVDTVSIVGSTKRCSQDCLNFRSKSPNQIRIEDGYIVTNFDTGKLYIQYIGNMEDSEGNLLSLDHDLINNYYEYAIKERIFENIYLNGDDSVAQRMELMTRRKINAGKVATNIRNTPEYSELEDIWKTNRAYNKRKYEDIILH